MKTRVWPALAVLLFTGCQASTTDPEPSDQVASVAVTPGEVSLTVGETRALSAAARSATGATLSGYAFTWTSSDETVAQVSGDGVVTAEAAGAATITAAAAGKAGEARISVATPPVASVALDATSAALEEGEELELTATPLDAHGNPISGLAVQWSSSDPHVAPVSPGGTITAIRSGSATVTARVHDHSAHATITVRTDYPYELTYSSFADATAPPEVFVLDLGGVEARALFRPGTFADDWRVADAAASPDGARIAAVITRATAPACLCLVNRDGTGLQELGTADSTDGRLAWSPDGQRIAFHRRSTDLSYDIWLIRVDGTGLVNLTEADGSSRSWPSWSPQQPDGGYRIAFMRTGATGSSIWTMKDDGSDSRQITTGTADRQPAWSPDGGLIAFQRPMEGGDANLWVANAVSGSARALTLSLSGRQWAPAWSPDGKLIAFHSKHETYGTGSGEHQIYTVWLDGSKIARRTHGSTRSEDPRWIWRDQ